MLDDRPFDPDAPVESLSRLSVIPDIEPFISPASGEYIGGRAQRREDMKRTGCVPYERLPGAPQGYRNARFAKKHGLPLNEG